MNRTSKETEQLIREVNRSKVPMSGGYNRCSICNEVNNQDIETNLGDFKPNLSFTIDPKDHSHFICITCDEIINDLKQDYEVMDEWNEEKG